MLWYEVRGSKYEVSRCRSKEVRTLFFFIHISIHDDW
jgi:hypothetical protein